MKSFLTKTFAIFLLLGIVSCSKTDLRQYDALQQLNAVESLNDPYLLSSILTQTCLFYQGMNFGTTQLPGAVQFTERNFQGGDNYYNGFRQPVNDMYSAMSTLEFINSAISLSTARNSMSHVGIFTTFRVALFEFMTAFYGDVYYSQALQGRQGILYPKYDHQADIYKGLLKELETAATNISTGTDVISPTYDLMFAGDKTQWLKFCNSLKVRLLIRESSKLSDIGAQLTTAASQPLLGTGDMNASIAYVGTTTTNSWIGGPNGNWGVPSDEFDRRRPSKTLVDTMLYLQDPRVPVWFAPVEKPWTTNPALDGVPFSTTDPNGFTYSSTWEYLNMSDVEGVAKYASYITDVNQVYVGFIAGMPGDSQTGNGNYDFAHAGNVGNFKVSKFGQLFEQSAHPLLTAQVMNVDEVQFNLAEAAANGWISGSADSYYRAGITASLTRWGVSAGAISTYLAQSSISLPGDKAGQLGKIALQKWIAHFTVADEAYLDLRRTKLPNIFNEGNLFAYPFPLRYLYPLNESGQNIGAYTAGVATLVPATDNQFSKMWLLQ